VTCNRRSLHSPILLPLIFLQSLPWLKFCCLSVLENAPKLIEVVPLHRIEDATSPPFGSFLAPPPFFVSYFRKVAVVYLNVMEDLYVRFNRVIPCSSFLFSLPFPRTGSFSRPHFEAWRAVPDKKPRFIFSTPLPPPTHQPKLAQ